MEVARSKSVIRVSQGKYIFYLLFEPRMLGSKSNYTFIEAGKRTKVNDKPNDKERYQRLVEKLIHLSHTKTNIVFAVRVVSQHMHLPTENHLEAVHRILKRSSGKGLFFKKDEGKEIEIHIDADWTGLIENRRSTNECCTFVWRNIVIWRNKKQNVVVRSNTKVKF